MSQLKLAILIAGLVAVGLWDLGCASAGVGLAARKTQTLTERMREVNGRLWHTVDEFTGSISVFPRAQSPKPLGYSTGVACYHDKTSCAYALRLPYAYAEFLPWISRDTSGDATFHLNAGMRRPSDWAFLERVYVRVGNCRYRVPDNACYKVASDVSKFSVFAFNRYGVDVYECLGLDYDNATVKRVVGAVVDAPLGTKIRVKLSGSKGSVDFTLPKSHHQAWKDMLFYYDHISHWWAKDIHGGWLGVTYYQNKTDTEGVRITKVIDDSPAALAGFRAGDIIVEVDGVQTGSPEAFKRQMARYAPETEVTFALMRGGEKLTKRVKLVEFALKAQQLRQ